MVYSYQFEFGEWRFRISNIELPQIGGKYNGTTRLQVQDDGSYAGLFSRYNDPDPVTVGDMYFEVRCVEGGSEVRIGGQSEWYFPPAICSRQYDEFSGSIFVPSDE